MPNRRLQGWGGSFQWTDQRQFRCLVSVGHRVVLAAWLIRADFSSLNATHALPVRRITRH